jgi:hypothetical protein
MNGKFDDMSSADENKRKHITAKSLMKTIKKQYIYSSIQDSKVVFFEVILVV